VTPTGTVKGGFGDAMSSVFHNNFPDYNVQLSVQIPIRNRSAQADNQRAILTQRQLEAQMQQLKNSALLDVRKHVHSRSSKTAPAWSRLPRRANFSSRLLTPSRRNTSLALQPFTL